MAKKFRNILYEEEKHPVSSFDRIFFAVAHECTMIEIVLNGKPVGIAI